MIEEGIYWDKHYHLRSRLGRLLRFVGAFGFFTFDSSSTNSASSCKVSGRMT
jgi:hypothetical protein